MFFFSQKNVRNIATYETIISFEDLLEFFRNNRSCKQLYSKAYMFFVLNGFIFCSKTLLLKTALNIMYIYIYHISFEGFNHESVCLVNRYVWGEYLLDFFTGSEEGKRKQISCVGWQQIAENKFICAASKYQINEGPKILFCGAGDNKITHYIGGRTYYFVGPDRYFA